MTRQPQASLNPILLTLAARTVLSDRFLSFLLPYFTSCGTASRGRRVVDFIHSSKLPSLPTVNKSKHENCRQVSLYKGYKPGDNVQILCYSLVFSSILQIVLIPYFAVTIDFSPLLLHILHNYTCKRKGSP